MLTIDEQQEIGRRILTDLSALDPCVIIAGGAPRNWMQGLPAKDLDIYIHFNGRGVAQATALIKALTGIDTGINGRTYETPTGPISLVLEGDAWGVKVQFMFVNSDVASTLDHFIVDNSKVWYKGRACKFDDKAILAEFKKEIWVNQPKEALTTQQTKYVEKISSYYPERPVVYVPDYSGVSLEYNYLWRGNGIS